MQSLCKGIRPTFLTFLTTILVAVFIAACGGGSETAEPTPMATTQPIAEATAAAASNASPTIPPTPAPTSTPEPTSPPDTPPPTPTIALAAASLADEYLARLDCESFQGREDAETYGDLSAQMGEIIDRMSSLIPPPEIIEWHELILSTNENAKAALDTLPEDDAIDFIEILAIFEPFGAVEAAEQEILSRMPDDVRQLMREAGCVVDEVGVETEPMPTSSTTSQADDHGDDTGSATAVLVGGDTAGVIDYGGDADYFSFTAEEGVRYQIDVALGTLDDSFLELRDSDDWRLAENDDFGDSYGSRIVWEAPESGDYYAVVQRWEGTGSYTLTIQVSDIVDDHGDDIGSATAVLVGDDTAGVIDYGGDADYFSFTAEEGVRYQIDVALGTLDDSFLELRDSDDWQLAENDDFGDSYGSRIVWEAPESGDYYAVVDGLGGGSGTYTLTIKKQ